MREICTSGSVRGGGGNVLTYSAVDLGSRIEPGDEGGGVGQARDRGGKAELIVGGGIAELIDEQIAEKL
jgi:hypothetical protein